MHTELKWFSRVGFIRNIPFLQQKQQQYQNTHEQKHELGHRIPTHLNNIKYPKGQSRMSRKQWRSHSFEQRTKAQRKEWKRNIYIYKPYAQDLYTRMHAHLLTHWLSRAHTYTLTHSYIKTFQSLCNCVCLITIKLHKLRHATEKIKKNEATGRLVGMHVHNVRAKECFDCVDRISCCLQLHSYEHAFIAITLSQNFVPEKNKNNKLHIDLYIWILTESNLHVYTKHPVEEFNKFFFPVWFISKCD